MSKCFHFYWDNHHAPGRNHKCTNVHTVSPEPKMAVSGEMEPNTNLIKVAPHWLYTYQGLWGCSLCSAPVGVVLQAPGPFLTPESPI